MKNDKIIQEIRCLFSTNIKAVDYIKTRNEHGSVLYCLFIGDRVVGVDIQKTFIDGNSMQEIEKHFSEEHIYHSILGDKICDHNGVFVTPNFQFCRDMS